MRIDGIDLIGNFTVRGATGQPNQAIGYSGSTPYWLELPTPIPGTTGPQGVKGPTFSNNKVGFSQIAIGDGVPNSMTGSNNFRFTHTKSTEREIFLLGVSNSIIRGNISTFSVAIMSATSISFESTYTSLSSTFGSSISESDRSIIFSGSNNTIIVGSNNSVILSGINNDIDNSDNSAIIGGSLNCVGDASNCSIILGGIDNCMYFSCNSTILGGIQHYSHNSSLSSIIGGRGVVLTTSTSSFVIGGQSNCVLTSHNSGIIGGNNNKLCNSINSVITGHSNATFSNINNSIITDKFKVKEFSKFLSYDNLNPINGDLWWDSNTGNLMFFKNDTCYCLEC